MWQLAHALSEDLFPPVNGLFRDVAHGLIWQP
jgi:hypothetical protein